MLTKFHGTQQLFRLVLATPAGRAALHAIFYEPLRARVFWDDRQICILPGLPSPLERARLRPSFLPEFLRHTGAGGFVWSGTKHREHCAPRQIELFCLKNSAVWR
jgi:hypothetical protein